MPCRRLNDPLLLLAVAIAVCGCLLVLSAVGTSAPRLSISSTLVNAGEIPLGATRTVGVKLQNSGDVPLRILGARGRCDCVKTQVNSGVLRPGASTELAIQVLGTRLMSSALQVVDVVTDRSVEGHQRVAVQYSVIPEKLTVLPAVVEFGRLPQGSLPANRQATVHSLSGATWSYKLGLCPPHIKVAAVGSSLTFEVEQECPVGNFYAEVEVQSGEDTYTLPLSGCIRGDVYAAPAELIVRREALSGLENPAVVVVRDRADLPFEIQEAAISESLSEYLQAVVHGEQVRLVDRTEGHFWVESRERRRGSLLVVVDRGNVVQHVNVPLELD